MKKFLIKISYTVLPVWLLLVGMATYLWITEDNSGDLMRLGLIDTGPEYTDSICAGLLPEVYYERQDNDSLLHCDTCDVLVVGDSFSNGGGVGDRRGDYVNYLAHDSGRKVVVFTTPNPTLSSPVQLAYDLMNIGAIDSTKVKNLVMQEVERYLVPRHTKFHPNHSAVPRPKKHDAATTAAADQSVGPLMRVKDYAFYHLFGANPIYKARLTRPMFGGKEPDKLFFYMEDVQMGVRVTDKQRQQIVDSYDCLIAKARECGINIIVLIASDKYDVYQNYIIDNPYPPKTLNEEVERLMAHEADRFVYAKRLLSPLVEQGVKDVYLFNDTHWSPASSQVIAAEIIGKLK